MLRWVSIPVVVGPGGLEGIKAVVSLTAAIRNLEMVLALLLGENEAGLFAVAVLVVCKGAEAVAANVVSVLALFCRVDDSSGDVSV